ncbi:MAG: TldD/PmbA family protein [Thermodesulfobacteriota bacterium]|nr:TldD/PmbA family protein [Thermodesulfobacteriota bacterium]
MKELRNFTEKVLHFAQLKGASYADVRVVPFENREEILVKNGRVENLNYFETRGFGVRVIYDGAWGFASSYRLDEKEIRKQVEKAIDIAKASAITRKWPVQLSKEEVVEKGYYKTPVLRDPFEVPIDEKVSLLLKADSLMVEMSKKIKFTKGALRFVKTEKVFANTEGAYIIQEITQSGGGIIAKAVDGKEVQARSYPKRDGNFACMGYEFIDEMNLTNHSQRIAHEALQLLKAENCPEGETTVILKPSQLYLQIHESIGHPIEADRILGSEITYAGGSFITGILDQLGSYRYGSNRVTIVADAMQRGSFGTFGYDDEGVPAKRTYIIKDGILTGLLTSRETIDTLNKKLRRTFFEKSNGTCRASSWNRIPLIRMTNISLMPGTWDMEDMISDTDKGFIFDTNVSWSIDDERRNFSFGTEICWEIKNGKIIRPLKNPIYMGITPVFWRSCDAICNEGHFEWYGTPNCGKGQPGQIMNVGHGACPARFRKVKVRSRNK